MRGIGLAAVAAFCMAIPCNAQTTEGAISLGLGGLMNFRATGLIVQPSGGLDVPVAGSFGVWGEAAWGVAAEGELREFSLGMSHRFHRAKDREVPFVKFGVAFTPSAPSGKSLTGVDFGAGVTYWTSSRRGLRLEAHDVVWGTSFNELVGRIGIALR